VGSRFDAELVVASTESLHERVARHDHACGVITFESTTTVRQPAGRHGATARCDEEAFMAIPPIPNLGATRPLSDPPSLEPSVYEIGQQGGSKLDAV
jgi:hypothetical protein